MKIYDSKKYDCEMLVKPGSSNLIAVGLDGSFVPVFGFSVVHLKQEHNTNNFMHILETTLLDPEQQKEDLTENEYMQFEAERNQYAKLQLQMYNTQQTGKPTVIKDVEDLHAYQVNNFSNLIQSIIPDIERFMGLDSRVAEDVLGGKMVLVSHVTARGKKRNELVGTLKITHDLADFSTNKMSKWEKEDFTEVQDKLLSAWKKDNIVKKNIATEPSEHAKALAEKIRLNQEEAAASKTKKSTKKSTSKKTTKKSTKKEPKKAVNFDIAQNAFANLIQVED